MFANSARRADFSYLFCLNSKLSLMLLYRKLALFLVKYWSIFDLCLSSISFTFFLLPILICFSSFFILRIVLSISALFYLIRVYSDLLLDKISSLMAFRVDLSGYRAWPILVLDLFNYSETFILYLCLFRTYHAADFLILAWCSNFLSFELAFFWFFSSCIFSKDSLRFSWSINCSVCFSWFKANVLWSILGFDAVFGEVCSYLYRDELGSVSCSFIERTVNIWINIIISHIC